MNTEYRKVFIATGFDKKCQRHFTLLGKSFTSDAIMRFTEKQITSFQIGIRFSKNFFGKNATVEADDFISAVNILLDECNQKEVETDLHFYDMNVYYISKENIYKILTQLHVSLSKKEKELKLQKKKIYR